MSGNLCQHRMRAEGSEEIRHRPCRRRAPPVPISRCERPCYLCRCCCSRCRGIPARAARPVSATMGPAISAAARGSSIRKRKRSRQALRIEQSTAKAVSARLRGSGNLQAAMQASCGCVAHVREHGPPASQWSGTVRDRRLPSRFALVISLRMKIDGRARPTRQIVHFSSNRALAAGRLAPELRRFAS